MGYFKMPDGRSPLIDHEEYTASFPGKIYEQFVSVTVMQI